MSNPTEPMVAPPGLKGVVVADTEIGSVRGDEGFYHYRMYDATELARTRTVEEIWFLLLEGRLPDEREQAAFRSEVGRARVLPDEVSDLVVRLAAVIGPPHLVLQASLGLVLPSSVPTLDQSPEQRRADVIRAAAGAATVLAIVHAVRDGRERPEADPERGHAEDWVRMLTGVDPRPVEARAVGTYLATTMDHGFNASTFATRVVTSTGADVAGALGSGVAALAGPLHGGAPSRALSMVEAIGSPANARAWVRARLDEGQKIMGFGHAVYRTGDPRSALLRDVAMAFGGDLVDRAVAIEAEILAELREWKPGAVIGTNVEYYAGLVLHLAGLAPEQFTSSFTVSRIIGWGAHLLEQAGSNKIIRPSARYVGPEIQRLG